MKVDVETSLAADGLTRYDRQIALPGVGVQGQKKLKAARVLCVGAGGLGSPVLTYLAAAGIGTLGIVDGDKVAISNLPRQILFATTDVAIAKVSATRNRLQALNPEINVKTYAEFLSTENAFDIIQDYDIVVDATDNYAARYLINDVCFYLHKPNVAASVAQFNGQCTVFTAENGPCYRCLYEEPPPLGLTPDCAEGGVFGVLPGVIGAIQATEVIKLILGIGRPLIGRLLLYDALELRFEEIALAVNSACRLCGQQQTFANLPRYTPAACAMKNEIPIATSSGIAIITALQLTEILAHREDVVLLDVREPYEYANFHLEKAQLIPLHELAHRYHELDSTCLVIAYCKVGARSYYAAEFLQSKGFRVANLEGGILAWLAQAHSGY